MTLKELEQIGKDAFALGDKGFSEAMVRGVLFRNVSRNHWQALIDVAKAAKRLHYWLTCTGKSPDQTSDAACVLEAALKQLEVKNADTRTK